MRERHSWLCWPSVLAAVVVVSLVLCRLTRLLDRALTAVARRLVGAFEAPGSALRLNISLWHGYAEIKGLQLDCAWLDALDGPFRTRKASIDSIKLRITWWYGHNACIDLFVSGVNFECGVRNNPTPVAAAAYQAEQAIANACARASKLAAIDSILWNSNPHQRRGAKLCRSLARHAAYQLISRLTVDVQNVSAAFNLDAPIASLAPAANFVPSGVWHPRAPGSRTETSSSAAATPEPTAGSTTASRAVRFQPDEPLGSYARVSLRSLTVKSATPQGYGVLATVCQLSGVDLAVDRPHAAGTAGERLHMVRRWSARAAVDWRIASRMLDMHKRVGETPVLQVNVEAAALLVRCNAYALQTLLSTAASFINYAQFYSYRRVRPQVGPAESPRLWWQHAACAVVHERRLLAAAGGTCYSTARAGKRRMQQRIYSRCKGGLSWPSQLFWLVFGSGPPPDVQLAMLERGLSVHEIALCRWRAWARYSAGWGLLAPRAAAANAEAMLESVLTIVQAQGTVRSSRARPRRAQLTLRCPKLSVMLQAPTSSAAAYVPVFEASLQQVCLAGTAGTQAGEQLQSGAGPLTLQATCQSLRVVSAPLLPSNGAASSSTVRLSAGVWDIDERPQLPLLECPTKRAARKLPQAFLALRFARPALQLPEPNVLRVDVAPISIAYSQACFSAVLAFVDAAWPAAAYDPLRVLASVTLANTVQERLAAPAALSAVRLSSKRLQLEVSMGTVLCTVPCSRQQQGNWIPAAAAPVPDGASIAAPNPQLVVVIDGFCGSSAKQTASTATQTGSALGGSSSRSLRHMTSSGKGASFRSGVGSSSAGRTDSASSAAQQSVSPTQAAPRASIMRRLLRNSSSGTPAASPTATSVSGSSLQHRKVHRRLRRQPDAQADEPHSIGKRTGATRYEQLFLGFSLEAYLLEEGSSEPDLRVQLVDAFTADLHVQHCFEPVDQGRQYRRVVAARLATDDTVVAHASEYISCQLCAVADLLQACARDAQTAAFPGSSQGDRDLDSNARVLALQLAIEQITLNVVPYPSNMHAGEEQGCFAITLQQTRLQAAIEDGVTDIRFDVSSMSVDDLTPDAAVQHVLLPLPPGCGCAGTTSRQAAAFHIWRRRALFSGKQDPKGRRWRLSDMPQHVGVQHGAQLQGHITLQEGATTASVCVNVLPLSLDSGLLRRIVTASASHTSCQTAATEQQLDRPASKPAAGPGAAASDTSTFGMAPRFSFRLAVDCGHVDMLVEGTRLATLEWQELQVSGSTTQPAASNRRQGAATLKSERALSRAPSASSVSSLAASKAAKQHPGPSRAGPAAATQGGQAARGAGYCSGTSSCNLMLSLQDWQLLDHMASKPAQRCAIGSNYSAAAAPRPPGQPPSPEGEPRHRGMQSASSLGNLPARQSQSGNCVSILLVRQPRPSAAAQHSGLTKLQLSTLGSTAKLWAGTGSDVDSAAEVPLSRRPSACSSVQAAAPVQESLCTLVQVRCERLHATLLYRFLADLLHLHDSVVSSVDDAGVGTSATAASMRSAAPAAPTSSAERQNGKALPQPLQGDSQHAQPLVPCLLEVACTELRLDVPRCSGSAEFLSLTCASATVLAPATSDYTEDLMPSMDRLPNSHDLRARRVAYSKPASGSDWHDVVSKIDFDQHSTAPWAFRRASHRDIHELAAPLAADHQAAMDVSLPSDLHLKFDLTSGACSWAARVGAPKLYWMETAPHGVTPAMHGRQVADGSDVGIIADTSAASVRIMWPWLHLLAGQAQYELMMGFFWENMEETSSFARSSTPVVLDEHMQMPQPTRLGVDITSAPSWEVDFRCNSMAALAERRPKAVTAAWLPGCGPDVARLRARRLRVLCGLYPCGGLRVQITSDALLLLDTRSQQVNQQWPVVMLNSQQDLAADAAEAAAAAHQARPARPPRRRHTIVNQLRQHVNTFITPGNGSVGETQEEDTADGTDDNAEDGEVWQDNFRLEYVLQPPPASRPDLRGPHVMEVVVREVQLQWPYLLQMGFLWDLLTIYCTCVFVPWARTFREERGEMQWMYINILFEMSELQVPFPKADSGHVMGGTQGSPQFVPDRGSMDGSRGLVFRWDTLRLLYFFGGNGEARLRIDAHGVSSTIRVPVDSPHAAADSYQEQLAMRPFDGSATVGWHTPKHDPEARRSVDASIYIRKVQLQPAFSQTPQYLAAMHALSSSMMQFYKAQARPQPSALHSHKRASHISVHANIASVAVVLVDDRHQRNIEVVQAWLHKTAVRVEVERTLESPKSSVDMSTNTAMKVLFLNSAVDAMDPLMEEWPLTLQLHRSKDAVTRMTLLSEEVLNVNITPSAFRSIGDVYAFVRQLTVRQPGVSRNASHLTGRCSASRLDATTVPLYRLVNRSGLRVSYWARSGVGAGQLFMLDPWEEVPLAVIPSRSSVVLPQTQQQVSARTICMQFEGHSTAVSDIVVDAVGKYAYTISSPHTEELPVIMDVALEERTKVLTVHSNVRIENHTSHALQFAVHVLGGRGAMLAAMTGTTISVPGSGSLAPGSQCYLPIAAARDALMYVQAVGWQLARKDKIDLDSDTLHQKQGLYTCPPSTEGQKPFHCCLQVQEEPINVLTAEGALMTQPEYVLRFKPPLTITNLLPFDMTVIVTDSSSVTTATDPVTFRIGTGGRAEVYSFDLTRKLRMAIQIQEFKSARSVIIHYANLGTEGMIMGMRTGLPVRQLAKDITLYQTLASKRITLELHNQMDAACKSREVAVLAPYWLLNKTDVPLQCKDTMPQAATPQMAAPSLGGLATPLLFSSSRGSMRLRVGSGSWSPSINLEKIGVHGTISVLGPPMPRQRGPHGSRRWMTPDASQVTLEEYEHVALPRKLAERNPDSRRGVSMDLRSVAFRASMAAAAAAPDSDDEAFDHQLAQPPALPSDAVGGGLHCGLGLHHWTPSNKLEQVSRYEFSVSSRTGPAIFHRTKVLTVLPRYVISNQSETPLDFAQVGSNAAWRLPSGDVRHPWHWSDVELPRSMCVRMAKDGWRWSGAFQMLVGDFGLRMTGPGGSSVILPVDISLSGASYLCIISAPNRQPPYRIDNRCQHFKVKFQQAAGIDADGTGAALSAWEEVEPGASLEYAWDEPQATRRLRCVLEDQAVTYRDAMHQYSLDEIRVYPPIKLKKANMRLDRLAGKVVTGVGSAAKSARRIVSRIGSAPDGMATPQQNAAGGGADSDVRLVYVSTHAEGVTRVLCFSDAKDQYARDAYAEDAAGLTRRLAQLDEHLQEVNAELDQLEDSSNLDMSLITDAPSHRRQRSPTLTSRLSATLSTRSSTSEDGLAIAGEAALAARLRRVSGFGASEIATREPMSVPGAAFGPRRVPSFLRTSMHRLGLRTMSMQADTSSAGEISESSAAPTPQPSGPLPPLDVVTPRLSVLLTPDTLPEDTRPKSAPGGARGSFSYNRTASISEEGEGQQMLAEQLGAPRLDSVSMPVPALRPRTAPPAGQSPTIGAQAHSQPSPFVRWAALQRVASDSVNVDSASIDPASNGDAAAVQGSTPATPAAMSPDASADGGSSGASSVRLSPATQGLVLPKLVGGGSAVGAATPVDDMPAASLAAAFQAVASPLLQSTPGRDQLPEPVLPQGAAYSRQAYAEQPTVWSSPGTVSDAASPANTLPQSPPAQQQAQEAEEALSPALRHSSSAAWEARSSQLPRGRRTATADELGSGGAHGPLARLPSQLRSVVPEAIALGGPQHGAAAIATIPEASPAPLPQQPWPVAEESRLRLSSLRAPSHEILTGGPGGRVVDATRLSAMGRAIAATAGSGLPHGSGELLGGELHVRIISGSNVLDALVHRQRTLTSESRHLKAMVRAAKLAVYCIVEVEGQQRRTVPVAGASDVLWNEELTFKTVRSTADLRVSVFARMRLGSDAFLGEVVIPLQEAASFGTMRSEVKRYTLGRRTTKEKVSGDIALGCRWRVSPLDVLALQVRGRQEELDHKQELVAIIKDWQPNSVAPSKVPQPSSCDGAGAASRWGGTRGRLEVRIIEARNLTFGSGVLNKFHTLNTFAVASCNDDAGTLPYATRPISRSLTPHWDELAVFKDVAPTDRLHISVLDRRLMGPHLLLGQVKVGVHEFADGRPHYAWLPLAGRAAAGSVGGEVHLRLQWRENEREADAEATAKFSFEVDLQGIGVSVIEASVTKLAREVMHVQLRRVHADYRLSTSNQSMRFALTDMQVDNQLLTSSQPVVLARARAKWAGQDMDEAQAMHARRPFLEVRGELLNNNNNILHFSSISIVQQEVDVALEEDFNEAMLAMLRDLPMQDIYQVPSASAPRRSFLDDQLDGDSALRSLLDASLESFNTRTRRERKIYFEKLDVAAIQCNLTLIPRPGQRAEVDPATMGAVSRFRLANVFGIHFSDVHALPLRIGSLQLSHAFMTLNQLTSQIGRHLLWTAIHEMHKILGQVDILGSPIVLANSLLAGGRAFLAEPAKARTPKAFARGVAAGTASLFRNGAFGALVAFGQLTGGLGKGLAVLSMDEEFIGRFRSAPADAQARMLHGLQSFGVGLLEGCTGVLKAPVAGYRAGGLLGAGRGALLGAAGLVLKPAAGGLELTSKTFSGLGIVVREAGLEPPPPPRSRARPPRQFGASSCSSGGAPGGMRRWQAVVEALEGIDSGSSGAVVDALQTKQGKATVFMADTLLYVDMRRRRLRWSIKLPHLTTVTTHGLVVVVHHSIRPSGRLFEWCDVRLPARRRVACASRETAHALNAKLNRALAVRAAGEATGGVALGAGGERFSTDRAPPHNAADLHIMHRSAPRDAGEQDEPAAGGTPRSGMAAGGSAVEAGGTVFADAIVGSGGLLPSSETVGLGPSSAGRDNDNTAADAGNAAPTKQQQQQQPQPQQWHARPTPDTSTQRQTRQAAITPAPDTGSATVANAAAALQLQPALRTLLLLCDCAGSSDRQMADTLMSIKMLADATSMKVNELGLSAASAERASAALSSVAAMCMNMTAKPAARIAGVKALCGAHLALEPGG